MAALIGSTSTNTFVDALTLGAKKKPTAGNAYVHHGRHFGRTMHAMCNIRALISNGFLRLGDDVDVADLPVVEQREHQIFNSLMKTVPLLRQHLLETDSINENEILIISESKGISLARSDDTKSLKGAVLDWICPRGGSLSPPLSRNVKSNRGFHHPATGGLLCPAGLNWKNDEVRTKLESGDIIVAGDQWPLLVYKDLEFNPEEPWQGLLRSHLLVFAFKHVFTSPSSVEKENKATRSGNARIHGMTRVTKASIAYIATQLRFSLSSASVFCRTDTSTDSERFYLSVLDFLEHPDEAEEVNELLDWWNCQVFPSFIKRDHAISKQSALAKLKEKRAAKRADDCLNP